MDVDVDGRSWISRIELRTLLEMFSKTCDIYLGQSLVVPYTLNPFEFSGILRVGPTKSLTFWRGPKICQGLLEMG